MIMAGTKIMAMTGTMIMAMKPLHFLRRRVLLLYGLLDRDRTDDDYYYKRGRYASSLRFVSKALGQVQFE